MRYKACLVAMLLGLAGVASAAQLKMQPGMWEDTIAGSDGSMHTEQKCYLQNDIDNMDAFQRGRIGTPEQSCKASGYQANGDTITYTLTCTSGGQVSSSHVTATYAGTQVTGTIQKDSGAVTRLTRRRVGDCSKSSLSNR